MKKLVFVVLVMLVGVFVGAPAFAGQVTVTWAVNHSASGGEFILATTDIGTFNSFCMEEDEYITVGGTYFYNTSNIVQLGGNNTDAGDPISRGTAWLFSQFAAGTLTGYGHTAADQTSLQDAFWMLEDEIAWNAANPWIVLAQNAIDGTLKADANGAYGVYAMNLWANSDFTGAQQSMLGVPDGGATLMLLGGALMGLGALRRKFRA
jgi:VPDSG-CTERM motif